MPFFGVPMFKTSINFLKAGLRKIFRRKFVGNFKKYCGEKYGHALLYYKTDYFALGGILESRSHINEWESYQIACILNKLGFWVDIIGITAGMEEVNKLEDKYDIFIGIGAGDSGKYFIEIAKRLKSAVRVLFALGPEPNLSNEITQKRHDIFLERHPGAQIEVRRLIKRVDIDELVKFIEAIFTNGNEFSGDSYKKFGKDIYRVWLSSYPTLRASFGEITGKSQKKFIYFGGNGNITKGLDLVIEAFSNLPELELYIGAAQGEEDFNAVMKPILEKSKNIHFLGFIDVKGELFNKISSECGYIIFPSSSEGCATSVTACMRRGIVPIVTRKSGVDIGDFGYLIKDIRPDKIAEQAKTISESPREDFIRRSVGSYIESFKYTRENFSATFEKALLELLSERKVFRGK